MGRDNELATFGCGQIVKNSKERELPCGRQRRFGLVQKTFRTRTERIRHATVHP